MGQILQGEENKMKKSKTGRLELPKDEMAFRRIYRDLLEKELLTTVFRPESRECHDERGYCVGQIVKARVLDVPGSDKNGTQPSFLEEVHKIICIENVEVKTIGSLIKKDFQGSSPDIQNVESLRYHLGIIYNLDPSDITNEKVITKITYSFITTDKEH